MPSACIAPANQELPDRLEPATYLLVQQQRQRPARGLRTECSQVGRAQGAFAAVPQLEGGERWQGAPQCRPAAYEQSGVQRVWACGRARHVNGPGIRTGEAYERVSDINGRGCRRIGGKATWIRSQPRTWPWSNVTLGGDKQHASDYQHSSDPFARTTRMAPVCSPARVVPPVKGPVTHPVRPPPAPPAACRPPEQKVRCIVCHCPDEHNRACPPEYKTEKNCVCTHNAGAVQGRATKRPSQARSKVSILNDNQKGRTAPPPHTTCSSLTQMQRKHKAA